MPMVTEPAVPAGAELPEAPPVKASPVQPLASKPQPTLAFTAPAPPEVPGSSNDPVPSKPMSKLRLYKVQPCAYPDVRLTAGAVPRSDAEAVAMEQAARLEAAQRARLAAAQAPAGVKPAHPAVQFTSDEVHGCLHHGPAEHGRQDCRPMVAAMAAAGNARRRQGQGQVQAGRPLPRHGCRRAPQRQGHEGQGGQGQGGPGQGGQGQEGPAQAAPLQQMRQLLRLRQDCRWEGPGAALHEPTVRALPGVRIAHPSPAEAPAGAQPIAAKKAAAANAAVAATEAAAAAAAAATLPPVWPAAGAAAWAAGAPVVIDDTQLSPLTPADAAAAAGHSDTDVSSPGGQPTNPAAWAQIGAYGKSKGPPTKDPSPANLAFMGGHLAQGPPAAGAAVETVDLLFQTPADAAGYPSPTPADAAGPSDTSTAGADELTAALAAMWPDGQGTQAEMLQWAGQELAARQADAQRDRVAFRAAEKQTASDHDKLCVAAMGAKEGLDLRMQQERRIAELAAREAARSARIALLFNWPEPSLLSRYITGFRSLGLMERTGVLRDIPRIDPAPIKDLLATAPAAFAALNG